MKPRLGLIDASAERRELHRSADDPQIQSIDQLLKQYLWFNQLQIKALSGLVMINDKTMRITSTGQVGKVIRQVEVIARKPGGNPQIISWKE